MAQNFNGSFKDNDGNQMQDHNQDGDGPKLNEKAGEYMRELLNEKIKIDQSKFPVSTRLIDQEVSKVQASGRIPQRDAKFVDVYREKPVKVVVKVLVPVKEHPKFNFVGKLLGPKGNTLKQLQEDTMCKMAVLGKGSIRDKKQEEDLRNSLDPKYAHLADDLHVEISALAPPAEAHARLAYALAEVRKYLVPDTDDMMRPAQMREMIDRPPRIPGPRPMPPGRSGPPAARPGPPGRMPPKNKVFSILDRARTAMESPYGGYDDPYAQPEMPVRGPPRVATEDYYGYERPQERYYDDEQYYKDETPTGREFKTSRDVGTRRAPVGPPRHFARASPYSRQPKDGAPQMKKQRMH